MVAADVSGMGDHHVIGLLNGNQHRIFHGLIGHLVRFFQITGGIDMAISRGLAYAPYADVLWCETCHNADAGADGALWNETYSAQACGGCHEQYRVKEED